MRRLAHLSCRLLPGCAILFVAAPEVQAQAAGEPLVVTVPDGPPPAPVAQKPRDPYAIVGIRIEGNGALITGPIGQRRVYIPLDKPVMPSAFKNTWAAKPEVCATVRGSGGDHDGKVPVGALLVTSRQLIARKTWTIQKIYVPLPDTFTLEMLDSGRPLVLPASRYGKAPKILVIYAEADGTRGYLEMALDDKGTKLQTHDNHGSETGLRCDK